VATDYLKKAPLLNSLTASGAHEHQLFKELHYSLVTLPIFVRY
jgi:hypothetical protein